MSDSNELPVFTVPRSKWYRGHIFDSSLLREDGCRCCLGHVAQQCGISDDELFEKAEPSAALHCHGYPDQLSKWPPGLILNDDECLGDSAVCADMMTVNDDDTLDDPDREAQLQELAVKAGFRLVFVDEVTNG